MQVNANDVGKTVYLTFDLFCAISTNITRSNVCIVICFHFESVFINEPYLFKESFWFVNVFVIIDVIRSYLLIDSPTFRFTSYYISLPFFQVSAVILSLVKSYQNIKISKSYLIGTPFNAFANKADS